MRRINTVLITLCFIFFNLNSCGPQKDITRNQAKPDFLYGEIDKEILYSESSSWLTEENNYQTDTAIVAKINEIGHQIDVIIFLGSWCVDSRRNVPRFYKVIKENTNIRIRMIALDRKKQIEGGLQQIYDIKRVPTFIFLENDKEIGRIVEYPKQAMENDVLNIIKTK